MPDKTMYDRIANGRGFIAALDQSGGSTPKTLKGYGYRGDEWSNDEEMFDLIHQMRSRIIRSPETSKRLTEMGVEPLGGTPEEFGKLIRAEVERFGKAVKASGAKAD